MVSFLSKYKNQIVIATALLFVALNLLLTYFEIYYLNLIPLLLIVVYIAFTRLDTLILISVFLIPLSVPLREITQGLSVDLFLPTEPILFGILLVFIYKLVITRFKFDKKVINHPVSYAIYFYLFWILITSITSTMPVVSFKYLLAKVWFLVPFYFLGTQLFRKTVNIKKFVWAYVLTFFVIIVYATVKHVGMGLGDKEIAHFVMQPFYNDHTIYGAIVAMFLPILIGLSQIKKDNLTFSVFIWLLIAIFMGALILSYSRAAWISGLCALVVFFVLRFKVKFGLIFLGVLGGLLFIYSQRGEIIQKLEQNRQDSSDNLSEHVQSISNISTDASNVERINRWKCAMKMFNEKPVFGWGPGTYQFKYAPFQMARDKTIISTNAGNRGNAHSEYIGPLAETGVLGSVSFLLIILFTLITGFRVYLKAEDREVKIIALTILMGLITYYVHGTLNNFLDTDKASAPFWGFTAILVTLDIYQTKQKSLKSTKEES